MIRTMSQHYGSVSEWMNPQSSASMIGRALPMPSMYQVRPMKNKHTKHSYYRTMILTVLHPHSVASIPFAVTALDAHGYNVSIASRSRAEKDTGRLSKLNPSRGRTTRDAMIYDKITVPQQMERMNRDVHSASQLVKQIMYSYSRVVQPFQGIRNDVVHVTLGTAMCSFDERGGNTGASATIVRTFGELPRKVQDLMRQLNLVGGDQHEDQRVFAIPVRMYDEFVEKLQALVPFVHRSKESKNSSKKVRFDEKRGGALMKTGQLLLMQPEKSVAMGESPYDAIRAWRSWLAIMEKNRRNIEGIDLDYMIDRHRNLLNPVLRNGGVDSEEAVQCVKALAFTWNPWLFSSYDLAELWYTFAQLASHTMTDALRKSRVPSWKGVNAMWKVAGDDMMIQFVERMVRTNMEKERQSSVGHPLQRQQVLATKEQAKTSVFRSIRQNNGLSMIQAKTDAIFGPILAGNVSSAKEALLIALGVHAFIHDADKRLESIKRDDVKQLVQFSQDEKYALLFPWIRALSQRHLGVHDVVADVARNMRVNKDSGDFMKRTLEMGEIQTALVLYRHRNGGDAAYPVQGYEQWTAAMKQNGRGGVDGFMDPEAYVDDFGMF